MKIVAKVFFGVLGILKTLNYITANIYYIKAVFLIDGVSPIWN
jgi:hypothetical protein